MNMLTAQHEQVEQIAAHQIGIQRTIFVRRTCAPAHHAGLIALPAPRVHLVQDQARARQRYAQGDAPASGHMHPHIRAHTDVYLFVFVSLG
jgi:hypothetical protein